MICWLVNWAIGLKRLLKHVVDKTEVWKGEITYSFYKNVSYHLT